MTHACIIWCVHLAFTVDRVEPPWAIVEWSPMGTTSDVHLAQFPSVPREGSRWTLRLELPPGAMRPIARITDSTHARASLSAPALTPPQPARTAKTTTGAAQVHSSTGRCTEPAYPEECCR